MKQRAILYLRTSNDADLITSLAAQRARLHSWADDCGADVVAEHGDACTGTTPLNERPGVRGLFGNLETFAPALVLMTHPDRLSRDPAVLDAFSLLVRAWGGDVVPLEKALMPLPEMAAGVLDNGAATILRGKAEMLVGVDRSPRRALALAYVAEALNLGTPLGNLLDEVTLLHHTGRAVRTPKRGAS